jgi:hypothetical protein
VVNVKRARDVFGIYCVLQELVQQVGAYEHAVLCC